MGRKIRQVCLLLHKKSCTRPEVERAIKEVRRQGVDISVRIPWSRKDQNAFIKDAIKAGVTRFVAGGGGTWKPDNILQVHETTMFSVVLKNQENLE